MKILKINLKSIFIFLAILSFSYFSAQGTTILTGIEKVAEIDGIQRFGTKQIPPDIKQHIVGYYRNIDNDNGLPYVKINSDNTGIVQIHNMEEHPMEFWLETDEKGELLIQRGNNNPNYIIVLIAKYDYSGLSKKDVPFSRIPVTMDVVNKKASIWSERVKDL